jgi:glutamyl-tRNA synthetase
MALFNYVFAKKHGGKFIVRIEDTDRTRYRKDSEEMILDAVKWVGTQWDEGPDVGGPHAPYRQSERTEIYRKQIETLLQKGRAYRCFCTADRLEEVRKSQLAQKLNPGYDRHCRSLSAAQVQTKMAAGESHTVRMMAPTEGKTVVKDLLRGDIEFDNTAIDDQVLMKSDGFPTYHLANVVDDALMEISHVIRGEEWISSTPKHVVLYEAFEWPKPVFIHLPLLRNPDKSKISKRKHPTSINYYRRKGILPEALCNFLALMGWNMGDDKEIFSTSEMIQNFSWDRFTLGGPVFDLQKLSWLNGQYLRSKSNDAWLTLLREEVFTDTYLMKIIPLVKERVDKLEDFITVSDFFFLGDLNYEGTSFVPKGRTAAETATFLLEALDRLETLEIWTHAEIHQAFENYLAEKGLKAKDVFMPMRIAVTGRKESPPLFETMEVLGKEMVRRRTRLAAQHLLAIKEELPPQSKPQGK